MRTTVTLDADTEVIIRRRMAEHGWSFKQALNDAIRRSVATDEQREFRTETASMGRSTVSLDRALSIAAHLEDDELMRRLSIGS